MTRREPLGPRALLTLVTVLALALATLAGLTWLRTAAPTVDTAVDLPAPASIHGAAVPLLDCEGPLPAELELPDGGSSSGWARSDAVLSCPDIFDPTGRGGPVVDVVGEVVGDVLERSDGAWLQVNDDPYALEMGPLGGHGEASGANSGLAIWVPHEAAVDPHEDGAAGLRPGRPDLRGDVVLVRGRVHRTDAIDGGGLTVRADQVEVIGPAQPVDVALHGAQAATAAGAVAITAGLLLWTRRRERR